MKLHIVISKAVTKEEWANVYDETAEVVQRFSMAEVRKIPVRGLWVECLVPVKEQYVLEKGKKERQWRISGDYKDLYIGADFSLSRGLMGEEADLDITDALYGMIEERENRMCRNKYVSIVWGREISDKHYFVKILAIACLIQTRLKENVFVFGDMTIEQCQQAVYMINEYVEEAVEMLDIFDQQRFMSRIQKYPFQETEKMRVFIRMYQGEKEADFGKYLREVFSSQVCKIFWKQRFVRKTIGTDTFDNVLDQYLRWGFDLNSLYESIDQECNYERTQYEKLVRSIMEMEIYKKEKTDLVSLEFDEGMRCTYSMEIKIIQFVIDTFQRRSVDCYIPLDDIRESLRKGFGKKWKIDSDKIIDNYLKKEAESKKKVRKNFKGKRRKEESYDISLYHHLLNYKSGSTIKPVIRQSLMNFFRFYREMLQEKEFSNLIGRSPEEKWKWLVETNKGVLLRDKDWERMFDDIEHDACSLARYYPLMRVKLDNACILDMARGIVLNDELYQYCIDMEKC